MPESSQLLISTLPPSRAQQRAAIAVAIALFAFFLAVLPFASASLPRIDSVIPVVSTIMFLGDCISAVLLFGQFAVLRTRALLVLAGGYLFTGLVVVAYALTFPGAFSESGLLGANVQTAAWIFVFWHLGLPTTVMAYALLRDARPPIQLVRMPVPQAIAVAAGAAVALASLAAWIANADILPPVIVDNVRLGSDRGVAVVVVCLSAAAFFILGRRRRSVLDTWLLVVLFAWVLDSVFTYITESRYTGSWYANRVVRIISANVVLFVLLAESTRLYARIVASMMAGRRERERRVMTMEAMSAAIEHEVRQPLGAIVANAGAANRWLEHSPPNLAEAREAMATIDGDARRATDILHAMRQLFDTSDHEHEALEPNMLIEDALDFAREELDAFAIGVQRELAAGLPWVEANRRQIEEVIFNLVQNAAESMHGITGHAAVLSITSTAAGTNRIEIAVADTGAGIDPNAMERIFDPFFTTKPGGMGMGLAICRSIVERHGGTLTVSHGDPYGAIFRVVLPCN